MDTPERRAPLDEQPIKLVKALFDGDLPKKDRRHEEPVAAVESVTAEAPDGELVTFVAEPDAPVVAAQPEPPANLEEFKTALAATTAEPEAAPQTLEEKVAAAFPPGYPVTSEDVARIRDGR